MYTFTCSYKIQADVSKNRMYCIMKGLLIDEYVHRVVRKIREEANKLSSGFDVISDTRELKPGTARDAGRIRDAQQYMVDKGVNRFVCVGDTGSEELYLKTKYSVSSLEEAEEILN